MAPGGGGGRACHPIVLTSYCPGPRFAEILAWDMGGSCRSSTVPYHVLKSHGEGPWMTAGGLRGRWSSPLRRGRICSPQGGCAAGRDREGKVG